MDAKRLELKPCPYRYGIAIKGKVLFKCGYVGGIYDLKKIIEICNNFCPLRGKNGKEETLL